jgi:hypothetical protein
MTALFLAHADPSAPAAPAEGSRRAAMEFLLRLGGQWGREEARHGREPYRTFEWRRACTLASTPVWILVLGWQDFDEDAAAEALSAPEDTPWLFMVEVWDTDVSVPDYDTKGTMVQQFQTRDFDLVAHVVQTILDHETVGA